MWAEAAERLAAVTGIVVPSKQGFWVEKDFKVHLCSTCVRKFARKEQVKYHMRQKKWESHWRTFG